MPAGSRVGMTQIARLQGFSWGGRSGQDWAVWLDGDTLFTDANGLAFKGPVPWADVKAYGAVGDGQTDDTAAIQAAIDAAKAGATTSGAGKKVYFPPGDYAVSSLDCTNVDGLELFATASAGVRLYATKQTGSSKPVLDFTGSNSCKIRNITVNGETTAGAAPTVRPTCAFLFAETSALGDSNKNFMEEVGTQGYFTVAPLYVYGSTDNLFVACAFQQKQTGQYVLSIDAVNSSALTSPYQTIATGTRPTGENTFVQCEFHDLSTVSGASTTTAIRLHTCYNIRFFGGNSGCAGVQHVSVAGTIRNILFSGVQFYSDNGTDATYVVYLNTAGVDGITLDQCDIPGGASAVFGGAANSEYDCPVYLGKAGSSGFAGSLVTMATPGVLRSPLFQCDNLAVNVGAGGSILGGLLIDPGTITAGTDTSSKADDALDPYVFAFADGNNGLGAGLTRYAGPGGVTASELNAKWPIPFATKIRNLRVRTGGSPGAGETFVFTFRVNAVDTALTCTISGTNTQASDLTNTIQVAAGDEISVKCVGSAGAGATGSVIASLTGHP